MPIEKYNPNHPTTQQMERDEMYMKLLLIMVNEHGTDSQLAGVPVRELHVTNDQMAKLLAKDAPALATKQSKDGIHLYLIEGRENAKKIARIEGGLPQ